MRAPAIIRDEHSGHISHTKLWGNIAYAAMTAVFIHMGWHGQVDAWLMFAYGAVVAGSRVANKFVAMKYQSGNATPAVPPAS